MSCHVRRPLWPWERQAQVRVFWAEALERFNWSIRAGRDLAEAFRKLASISDKDRLT